MPRKTFALEGAFMTYKRDASLEERVEQACALYYNREEGGAPRLIAKGERHIAEEIVRIAEEHDIPVLSDVDTVFALLSLEVGDEIPEDLYEAVSVILAFVYGLRNNA